MHPFRKIYSVGTCPVCHSSSNVLVLLDGYDNAVFFCPSCQGAWRNYSQEFNEVNSLEGLAPYGVHFPTELEIEKLSLGKLRVLDYSLWASVLDELKIAK